MARKYWSLTFDNIRIDITITTDKGKTTGFSVNLSILVNEKRVNVVRWDTSHGFLHKHEFWRTHRCIKDKKYEGMPLDMVFRDVYNDLLKNREKYLRRMLGHEER